ncbi:hypothetical protein ASF14_16855 [Sphingomonas sp. Leaf257]|nr:hypothetical protein ASF14_16855 [Sphingomonas sp. Leaf257]
MVVGFSQRATVAKRVGKAPSIISRREDQRYPAFDQDVGDRIGQIPAKIDVENGPVDPPFGSGHLQSLPERANRAQHHRVSLTQFDPQIVGDQKFVLRHQNMTAA